MNRRLARLTGKARPPRIALVSMFDVENNAVRLLSALLRQDGHHAVEIYFKDWISNHLPPPTDQELESFLDILRRERVDLLCLSIRASAYDHQARVLTRLAHERLDLPVMWGGMHPTVTPEDCIGEADLLLVGEGEGALVELARHLRDGLPIDGIQNLWLRTGADPVGDAPAEGVIRNPLRPLIKDLDTLPFRDFSTHEHKYFVWGRFWRRGDPMRGDPVLQMMASRGCIYRCSYCYNSTFKNDLYKGQRWYRTRSVGSVIQEINQARTLWKIKRIRFDDEVFNFHKGWFAEFCRRYPVEVGLPFEIFVEPKLVTRERMEALKEAGLTGVYMGIQSSERVTDDLYDRHVKDSDVSRIAVLLHELGIYPHYQLIFDDPVSTEEDHQALFEMIAGFPRPYDLFLFSMTVFPGSKLNRTLIEDGVITEYDIEGANTRTFYQHRVNLEYPRPVGETFWIALVQMLSKDFIPVSMIRPLTRSRFLRRHPWPLIQFAHATNYVKLGSHALHMVAAGEMTGTLIRRWLDPHRIITT